MRQEPSNNASRGQYTTNGSSHPSSPNTNKSLVDITNGTTTNGFHSQDQVIRPNDDLFYGHNREEVTRILLQSLSDLGYSEAAASLSRESGYRLEAPTVVAFRTAILAGEWAEAEALLFGPGDQIQQIGGSHDAHDTTNGYNTRTLPLADGADKISIKFLIRQQKYLEFLEARDIGSALHVLRNELTPLKRDIGRLHSLSALMMCSSPNELRTRAGWDGVHGESRSHLLSELSKSIAPSFMIPEHRLATLLDKVQSEQVLRCKYHNTSVAPSLYTDHECSIHDFPLHPTLELKNFTDEIYTLAFSDDGSMLAAAGREGMVCVWDTARWKIRYELRDHERNATSDQTKTVCQVAFSPDAQYLLSCSVSHEFVVTRMRDGRVVARGEHFEGVVVAAAWLPDSEHFIIGSQDTKRPLSLYNLRNGRNSNANNSSSSSSSVLVEAMKDNEVFVWTASSTDDRLHGRSPSAPYRITALAVSKDGKLMAAGTIDHRLLTFDLSTKERKSEWHMDGQITSITFSADNQLLLVNMSGDNVLALDSDTGDVRVEYKGVVNRESVLHSGFGGASETFVVSGSEDSIVKIWRRQTGVAVAELKAHHPGYVNAVAWHPTNPGILASAGDDRRINIWTSTSLRSQNPPLSNL